MFLVESQVDNPSVHNAGKGGHEKISNIGVFFGLKASFDKLQPTFQIFSFFDRLFS